MRAAPELQGRREDPPAGVLWTRAEMGGLRLKRVWGDTHSSGMETSACLRADWRGLMRGGVRIAPGKGLPGGGGWASGTPCACGQWGRWEGLEGTLHEVHPLLRQSTSITWKTPVTGAPPPHTHTCRVESCLFLSPRGEPRTPGSLKPDSHPGGGVFQAPATLFFFNIL